MHFLQEILSQVVLELPEHQILSLGFSFLGLALKDALA